MTDAERQRAYRAKNREYVARDNAARRARVDCRNGNKFKRLLGWIKDRCTNKRCRSYPYYGGAGVECRVDEVDIAFVWVRDRAWRLERPELDRRDPTGHYEIENIRFIEKTENLERRRPWGTVELEPAFVNEESAAVETDEPGSGG